MLCIDTSLFFMFTWVLKSALTLILGSLIRNKTKVDMVQWSEQVILLTGRNCGCSKFSANQVTLVFWLSVDILTYTTNAFGNGVSGTVSHFSCKLFGCFCLFIWFLSINASVFKRHGSHFLELYILHIHICIKTHTFIVMLHIHTHTLQWFYYPNRLHNICAHK